MTAPAIIPPGRSTSPTEVSAATGTVLVGAPAIVVDGAVAARAEEVEDDGTDDVVVEDGGVVDVGTVVVVVVGIVVVVVVEVEEVVVVVDVVVVGDVVGVGEPPLRVDSTSAIKDPTT